MSSGTAETLGSLSFPGIFRDKKALVFIFFFRCTCRMDTAKPLINSNRRGFSDEWAWSNVRVCLCNHSNRYSHGQ